MISWFRTYNARVGKMDDLLKLSKDAVKHLKQAHGLKYDMYAQVGADPTRIGLVCRYKDMGAVGKLEAKIARN